ncbi:MAG TPA: amidohydrolase [Thermomicrobiales bacterium]|jgi:aminobenzoyl-glutamate utilization protein B|nr:amidohydrolase [Thermomicrobiales bacterium]
MPTTLDLAGWLDERQERFTAIADAIWAKPEVALRETAACALQAEILAADGFAITRDVGGLPTAFVAEWGSGQPVLGFLGEYDALPGLSQESQATQTPIVADGPGHGCGHNLLGTAALAAAMALKAWLKETGQAGTVRYYGCPAEETIVGKVYMARAGVFDDLDAALTWHPGWLNTVSLGSSLAVDNLKFRFHGKTAHAAMSPEQGRSALDAVELMNVGVNFLREHVPDAARIHYVITNGGGAPNVVPDEAEVWYFVRSPERAEVEALTARVRKIAQGAALMTETTVKEDYQCGAYNLLPNRALADLAYTAMQELGSLPFTDEERAYAQTVADGYPAGVREAVLRVAGLAPDLLQSALNGDVHPASDEGKVMPGSTDVGDVSWITPTVSLGTACWALGIPGHSWGIVATGAMSIGHKGMLYAAQALAVTAAELVSDPAHLTRARAEFQERTGGQPYRSPLPADATPPLPGSGR